MSEDFKTKCEKLKKRFDEGVDLNGKLFKDNSNYQNLTKQDWCQDAEDGKAFCAKIMVGLDAILNPDDKYFGGRTFASALDTVCTDGSKTTDPGWLEALGELIGHGIDASKAVNDKTKNFNKDLTQAQQSGASNVAMASSLGSAAGIGERPFGPLLLFG